MVMPWEGQVIVAFGAGSKGCIASIGIMSVELPEYPKVTLEDYYSHCRMQLINKMENEKPVLEGDTTIGGLPAKTLMYIVRGETYAFMVSWAFFLKENRSYFITYDTYPECHADYVDCFELMLSTFKFE